MNPPVAGNGELEVVGEGVDGVDDLLAGGLGPGGAQAGDEQVGVDPAGENDLADLGGGLALLHLVEELGQARRLAGFFERDKPGAEVHPLVQVAELRERLLVVPRDLTQRSIDPQPATVEAHERNADRRVIECRPESLFALPQGARLLV